MTVGDAASHFCRESVVVMPSDWATNNRGPNHVFSFGNSDAESVADDRLVVTMPSSDQRIRFCKRQWHHAKAHSSSPFTSPCQSANGSNSNTM